MTETKAKVRITGRVQGVWFRQSTKEIADRYGIKGWCRNNPDGSVEAVFEGEEAAVKAVINWCHDGPDLAHVDSVQVTWKEADGGFSHFEIH